MALMYGAFVPRLMHHRTCVLEGMGAFTDALGGVLCASANLGVPRLLLFGSKLG